MIDPRLLAPLICIVGLIIYLVTKDKPSEIGKWMFIIGLFTTLWKGIA